MRVFCFKRKLTYCPNCSIDQPVRRPPKAPPSGMSPLANDHNKVNVSFDMLASYRFS